MVDSQPPWQDDEEEAALKQQAYDLGYEAALNDDCDYPYHGQNPYEEGCALEFLWSGGWEDAKLTTATCRSAAGHRPGF